MMLEGSLPRFYAQRADMGYWRIYDRSMVHNPQGVHIAILTPWLSCHYHAAKYWGIPISEWVMAVMRECAA